MDRTLNWRILWPLSPVLCMSVLSKPIYLFSKLIYPALMLTNTVLKLGYLCFWRVNLSKQQKYNGKTSPSKYSLSLLSPMQKESTWHKQGESLLIAFLNIFAVLKNDKDHSKPIAGYFNLPNHSTHNTTISNKKETWKVVKTLNKSLLSIRHRNPPGIKEGFLFNYFIHMFTKPFFHQWHSSSTKYKRHRTHNPSVRSDKWLAGARNVIFEIFLR